MLGRGAFRLGLCLAITMDGRLGECVSDGGDEIGESCVLGGGVLPRKGRLPRDGGLVVLDGKSGLDGLELLLWGGAIISSGNSGVSERASIDGSTGSKGSRSRSSSSSLSCPVAGIDSSGSNRPCGGNVGLDCGTCTVDNLRFLELEDDKADEDVATLVFERFNGVDSSSGSKSSSSSS